MTKQEKLALATIDGAAIRIDAVFARVDEMRSVDDAADIKEDVDAIEQEAVAALAVVQGITDADGIIEAIQAADMVDAIRYDRRQVDKMCDQFVALSNTPLLLRAADAAITGDDISSGALAMGLIGAMDVCDSPLVAVIGEERLPFVASDYLRKPKKDDGKVDGKLHSARSAAIMVDLYGQSSDDIAPAVQTMRDKTLAAGVYAKRSGMSLKLVKVVSKSGKVRHCVGGVPAGEVLPLFDDDNKQTAAFDKAADVLRAALTMTNGGEVPDDEKLREAVLFFPIVCDGSDLPMFGVKAPTTGQLCAMFKEAASKVGIADPIEGRAPRNGGGNGDKLLEHATAIETALKAFLDPANEASAPPSKDFESKMDVVAESWAAYRVANPLDLLDS
jgi:hypothetical protein